MDGITAMIVLLFLAAIYFLPWLVAGARHHHQGGAIFIINLFLGWTFLGWVIALAMAMSAVKPTNENNQGSQRQ